MSLQHHFVCPLPNGIHARPASQLELVARKFTSEFLLLNERNGRTVNVKSVLSVISADIRYQDPCRLTVSGPDEAAAMAALTAFVGDAFPHCDDSLPAAKPTDDRSHLPSSLRDSSIRIFHGTAVVAGVAQGRLLTFGGFEIPASLRLDNAADPAAEAHLLEEALQKLAEFYDRRLASVKKGIEADLLMAHQAIARDSEFRRRLLDSVAQCGHTAAGAIAAVECHFTTMLAESDSPLLRERVLDIEDICLQLLRHVYGDAAIGVVELKITRDTIVAAETLTPSQFLALDRNFLKGLVLGQAGGTSHTVILARSFGIPTLAGIRDLGVAKIGGQEVVVDANAGVLVTNLNDLARRYYALEFQRVTARRARMQQFATQPAAMKDGHRIEIAANISRAEEAAEVFANGADGIGLFRTEMLFFDRESAPSEEEQFESYRRVLLAAKGRTVIIRTLDIGGDKPLHYLKLPTEENPFLGRRAVRLYPDFEPVFRNQIRALIRASAHGRLHVMIPLVATLDEVRWVRKLIAGEQAQCLAQGIAFDPAMPVGAMVEVPAIAFALDHLCRELDFFSIGSNDLLQYFMAADRTNARLSALYNPLHPAFLRLLKQIVSTAHAHHKWIGLCGEMGGQTQFLPLLAGLGLDEISLTAPAIPSLKAELTALTFPECEALLDDALKCSTAGEVAVLLENFTAGHGPPLIDPELILLDTEAATKEEAIKLAVNQLYVVGRTNDSRAIEEAVWQREQAFSTGFGDGFAMPHCKTNAVVSNALVLAKLRSPIAWNSVDGRPVRMVLLLVTRECEGPEAHLQVFAKLARQMINEDFRARLEIESDAEALCAFLRETVQN
jgi:multiphosphoryl transfer protein